MKIYTASKIWHAPLWQSLRDSELFTVTARWIDYCDGDHPIVDDKPTLWQHCLEDVTSADAVILYCGAPDEQQRGAVMEAGHAIGQGKPVYCVNTCETFQACETSDVAFTHHKLWNWIRHRTGEFLPFDIGVRLAYQQAWTHNRLDKRLAAAAYQKGED